MKMTLGRATAAVLATCATAAGAGPQDGPTPPMPSPTVVHSTAGHAPPPMPPPVGSMHGGAHAFEEEGHHSGLFHREVCEECTPGVYKSERTRFRGFGYVARRNPWVEERATLEQVGNPHELSTHAEPSYGPNYTGYYVGGGASMFCGPGFGRRPKEGTWGWDYECLGWKRRVHLLFSRGALYQGGEGQYEPDPPYEIPNVLAIRYGERLHRLLGHGEVEGE